MKVLLSGHLGYIGTVMAPMLVQAGHEVVGIDSDLYRRCTFAEAGQILDLPAIHKDTRDITAADVEGFDAVIHLAALSNDPLSNLNPDLTYAINHRASGTRLLGYSALILQSVLTISLVISAAIEFLFSLPGNV